VESNQRPLSCQEAAQEHRCTLQLNDWWDWSLDSESASGKLRILHSAHNYPGTPGVSRNRLTTFISEGGVSGMDISTVAFDENQLAMTADVIVPGTIDRVLQLLPEDPLAELFGPFSATDDSMRTNT
jgi:hypothetical protein